MEEEQSKSEEKEDEPFGVPPDPHFPTSLTELFQHDAAPSSSSSSRVMDDVIGDDEEGDGGLLETHNVDG